MKTHRMALFLPLLLLFFFIWYFLSAGNQVHNQMKLVQGKISRITGIDRSALFFQGGRNSRESVYVFSLTHPPSIPDSFVCVKNNMTIQEVCSSEISNVLNRAAHITTMAAWSDGVSSMALAIEQDTTNVFLIYLGGVCLVKSASEQRVVSGFQR